MIMPLLLWIKRNKVGAISFACFLVALLFYCQPFFSLSFGNHPLNSTFPSHDDGAEMPGQAVVPAAAVAAANLGGYASKVSLTPGESINFHISTDWATPYNLTIWREGATRTLMTTLNNVVPAPYNCVNGYATGCNWPVARQFAIPGDWPSGVYGVDIPTVTAGTQHIIFIVRGAQPGATSKILSLSSVNTWQAYNNYGGKSLYDDGSSDGVRSPRVSLNRPYEGWGGYGEFPRWEGKYVRWMEEAGYPIEYATTYDLESVPTLLDGYDVVVIVGHSEYWTWNARQRLKQFIANGGRFINFSGNTMWWQVRFEDNGRTMVGYKDYIGDPIKAPELSTDNPWDRPIFDSPYPLIGAHWTQGGYPFSANLAFEQGYGGYKVQQADHWVFANTGLTDQSLVGRNSTKATTILDHEVDGSSFNCTVDGYTVLSPLANTGVAENFTILGIAPAYVSYLGFGVMGIYTNEQGGATFSTNTTGWANGLGVDPQISQITRNVLDRFLDQTTPMPQEAAGLDTHLLFYDRFNCNRLAAQWPTPNAPEWSGLPAVNYVAVTDRTAFSYDDNCGVSGSGLKLPVGALNSRSHSVMVKPNWRSTPALYSSLYVNLAQLTLANGHRIDLLRMGNDPRTGGGTLTAALQLKRENGNYYMSHTAANQAPTWLLVPKDRPFLVKTAWNKAENQLSLWVDGTQHDQTIALGGFTEVNRVELGLFDLSAGASGFLCVDEFVLNDEPVHNSLYGVLSLTTRTEGQGTVIRDPEKPRYGDGERVTLMALPAPGWGFAQWSGIQTTNTPTATLSIEEHTVVTATFAQLLPLQITVTGQGKISRTPAADAYHKGATVTLNAEAAPGWRFIGWSGDVIAQTASLTVIMDSGKSLTATFEQLHTLAVTVSGEGQVQQNPLAPSYPTGAQVTLTAQPATGWRFVGWGGAVTGDTPTMTITMDTSKQITALFEQLQPLSITIVGNGTVTRIPDKPLYAIGEQVSLVAQAAAAWHFLQWQGTATNDEPTTTITIGANQQVTVTFVETTYTLQVEVTGEGSVSRDPDQTAYPAGRQVRLAATPAAGWYFVGWQGAASGDQPVTLTMDADRQVRATFAQLPQVTPIPRGQGTIQVTPDLPFYPIGTQITVTAVPAAGWHFSNWTGNVTLVDPTLATVIVTVERDLQLVANFIADEPKIYLPLISR